MKKYLKYVIESFRIGGFTFSFILFKYYFFKKAPAKDMEIKNPVMGNYFCRGNTIDFLFTLFSYEYKIKSKILLLKNEFDIFIDIGACIGDYSIWMSKNKMKCFAFEPNKDNYISLVNNVKLNLLESSIKTYNYGLGNKTETVTFKYNPVNRGFSGKYADYDEFIKQDVEIKIFDEIFNSLELSYSQSIIMKIDAEGMEAEIIDGAKSFFSNIQKVLLIFESHTGVENTLKSLERITSFEVIEMDKLNIGVLINNTNKLINNKLSSNN
jgi:FkbM family methyltransferase